MLSLAQLRVATRPISLAAAPENILPDEVILEYVLAEPASYCLALTRAHAETVKLPCGQGQIDRSILPTRNDRQRGQSSYGRKGRGLAGVPYA